jgi:hypothetical protein
MCSTRLGCSRRKTSRDYECGINVDDDFETTVYELKAYFGFFRIQHTCETILRFYSYDGTTNYVRYRTGDFKEIDQSLWYSVLVISISGVVFLGILGN